MTKWAFTLCALASLGLVAGCSEKKPASAEERTPAAAPQQAAPNSSAVTAPAKQASRRKLLVPAETRRLLSDTMLNHGDNMESLLWSALMLDHESIATISEWMSEPPLLRRADTSNPKAPGALPELFFDYQDKLQLRAKNLRATALARNDGALAGDVAAVVETCVGCHALFGGPATKNP